MIEAAVAAVGFVFIAWVVLRLYADYRKGGEE